METRPSSALGLVSVAQQFWPGFANRFPKAYRRLRHFPQCILLASAFLVVALSLWDIVRAVRTPYPIDMWEAAATTVAARVSMGEPLYAHMHELDSVEPGLYAPLQPLLLGTIFRFTGPNLLTFRLINVAAGALFVGLLLRCLLPQTQPLTLLLALAILLGADRQVTGLWALPRLDAVLLLLTLVYLLLSYRAVQRQSFSNLLFALGILIVGLLWKQTMIAVAFVPLLASFLIPRGVRASYRWLLFLAPLTTLLLLGSSIALLSPNMYEAVVRTGGRFALQPVVLLLFCKSLLLSTPLLWITLTWVLVCPPAYLNHEKLGWATAAFVGALPLNLAATAKVGGGANSLAMMLYAAYAAVLLCLPSLLSSCQGWPLRRRLPIISLFGVGLLLTGFTILDPTTRANLHRGFGDAGREVILQLVRDLPGKVVCPQDPTIPLMANHEAGVALVNEWDQQVWHWPLPKVLHDIHQADFVVTFGQPGQWQMWPFEEGWKEIEESGYSKLAEPRLAGSAYTIWQRPKYNKSEASH